MIDKILTSLNIKILPRDLKSTEAKIPLQSLFNSWIPLSKALLDVVVEYLPSPLDLTNEKIEHLMCSRSNQFKLLPVDTQNLKNDFLKCDSDKSKPLIVYISKMFAVDKENICRNKRK
jgi:ribosome assembly protein 1